MSDVDALSPEEVAAVRRRLAEERRAARARRPLPSPKGWPFAVAGAPAMPPPVLSDAEQIAAMVAEVHRDSVPCRWCGSPVARTKGMPLHPAVGRPGQDVWGASWAECGPCADPTTRAGEMLAAIAIGATDLPDVSPNEAATAVVVLGLTYSATARSLVPSPAAWSHLTGKDVADRIVQRVLALRDEAAEREAEQAAQPKCHRCGRVKDPRHPAWAHGTLYVVDGGERLATCLPCHDTLRLEQSAAKAARQA